MDDTSDHNAHTHDDVPLDDDNPTTDGREMVKRGATVMKKIINARSQGIKFEIRWNSRGQPVNPNKSKFVSYIGVITRMTVPITYDNWRLVPEGYKDIIWKDLEVNFFH